jgi:hypothetical protein
MSGDDPRGEARTEKAGAPRVEVVGPFRRPVGGWSREDIWGVVCDYLLLIIIVSLMVHAFWKVGCHGGS